MSNPRWLDDNQQHVWQAYLHLNQHLYATLEDQLVSDAGLSAADYKVLHPLSESPGGVVRARELGMEIGWDRSRLSHQVTRMEKRGLVVREECAEDGRGLMVRVTASGRKAIEAAAPQHVENVRRYFFDMVTKQELETLAAVFDRLLENLVERSDPSLEELTEHGVIAKPRSEDRPQATGRRSPKSRRPVADRVSEQRG